MKNLIFILLIALGFFLAIFFFWKYDTAKSGYELANHRMTDRDTRIYQLEKQVQQLKSALNRKPETTPDTIEMELPQAAKFADELGSLSETDISRLQKKGLRSPEVDLMNDLIRKQKRLLPAKGTMGGTMAIRDSRILNDRYALAYFEDGHNGGTLLLKYSVTNGAVTWKLLDTSTL